MYKASEDKTRGIVYESFLSGCFGCGAALLLLFIGAVIMRRRGLQEPWPRIIFTVSVTAGSYLTAFRLSRKVRLGAAPKIFLSALFTLLTLGITAVLIERGEVRAGADLLGIVVSLLGSILGTWSTLFKSNKDYRKVTAKRASGRRRLHHN